MLKKIKKSFVRAPFMGDEKSERGQSFVELAISIVFLLTLLAAMIDLGWAFYTLISLRDAAQEAAVYGAMCPNYPDLIVDRLQKSAGAPLDIHSIPTEDVAVCIVDPKATQVPCAAAPVMTPALGLDVRVEVTVHHEIKTPFVAAFIRTTTYPLHVNVTDAILRANDAVGCDDK